MPIPKSTIEKEAIELVSREVEAFRDEYAFITSKVAFQMRNIIEKARKNYYGIFEEPIDPNTGLEKIWVPLTEWTVEQYVKHIDLDLKDINIRATTPRALHFSSIVRNVLYRFLKKLNFSDLLNEGIRKFAIDGTWVQKSFKGFDPKTQKQTLKTYQVDLLNFFIDPSAKSIQDAPSVIERAILTPDEIETYRGVWLNIDKIQFKKKVSDLAGEEVKEASSEVPAIDVWERWGKFPKYFITGNLSDKNVWTEGVIIVSGLNSQPVLHKILEVKKGLKPYEEAWFRKVPNRWFGRGIPEMLMKLQEYVNEVVNTRRNNNLLIQNRLFEIRKGSGITPEDLSKLIAGGGILVTEIGRDIRELPVTDQRASSYNDEVAIYNLAQKVTGSYELYQGERLPSRLSATTAALITSDVKTGYSLVQEQLGTFLERLVERHWLPIIWEILDDQEILNILADAQELEAFDKLIIEQKLEAWIWDFVLKTGFWPEEEDIEKAREDLKNELKKFGKQRFVKIRKNLIDISEYEIDVYVTGEKFDKAVLIQNLNNLLMTYARMTESALDVDMVIKEVLDILGLGSERFFKPQKEKVALTKVPPKVKEKTIPETITEALTMGEEL